MPKVGQRWTDSKALFSYERLNTPNVCCRGEILLPFGVERKCTNIYGCFGKGNSGRRNVDHKNTNGLFYYYFSINDFWINFALWFLRLTISKQFWISHGAYFCSHKYLLFTEALLFYQIFLHWTKYAINLKFIRQMTSFTTYEGYQNRDSMLQLKYLTIKIFQLN